MDTAYFYSDETGSHTKGRYFLVAGVVLTRHQKWIADQLHHAERVSGKGKQDWKGEKNVKIRIRYLEEVFAIKGLHGAVFIARFRRTSRITGTTQHRRSPARCRCSARAA